jgi:zinc transport system substrate-binding protein
MARFALALVLLTGLTACGEEAGSADEAETTDVVAAFYPLAWAAERVAGDTIELRNLTPAGGEPHDVELTARDVERIRSDDFVLYLGGGFQPAVEDAVEGAEGQAIDLLDEPVGGDPHVWLDPMRFARLVERVAEALGDAEDADEPVAELHELDRDFRSGLRRCAQREIVTSHDAFGYLARRYRLKQVAITGFSPEAEPTPRRLEKVVDRVRQTGATTVFFETLISPRLAKAVARETGARTAELNPLEGLTEDELEAGEDYLSVMRENLAALRNGLGCR